MSQGPGSSQESESDPPAGPVPDEKMTESMREVMSLQGDRDKLRDYYDRWADNYDADVADHGYGLPESMVSTLSDAVAAVGPGADQFGPNCDILDAGCGTGLVGAALSAAGYRTIDGIDLSSEMVSLARKRGVYRRLEAGIDLTAQPPGHLLQAADIVTVGGVFTVGHVPPSALRTIARLARPGGLLIVSTRPAYQAETGFDDVSGSLVVEGVLTLLVHNRGLPYTMDSNGDYWAYRVAGPTSTPG